MYFGLADVAFYLYFVLFVVAILFSWFIPGWVLLSHTTLSNRLSRVLLSFPVGMSLWGLQGYVFGFFHLRVLTWLYILLFLTVFIWQEWKTRGSDFKVAWMTIKKQSLWLVIVILLSSLIQIFGHIGSGLHNDTGVAFYFVNSVDGVMHLSYIQSLVQHFPPQEPGAAGMALANYHYWSDLVLADLVRIWKIPTIHIFFQYMPILLSILTTTLFVTVLKALGGSTKTLLVGLLLLTIGGDAAYVISLVLHGTWAEHVASLDSGVSFYFNMPQVFARFIYVGALLLLIEWWQRRSFILGAILCVVVASLVGFKIYYALYAIIGLSCVVAYHMVTEFFINLRKGSFGKAVTRTMSSYWQTLVLLAILALISLWIYVPTNGGAGGLTFSFFEWPHRFLSADNIDYQDWFLRMQVYEAAGNTRNVVIFNLFAVFLTFIAIYGTRVIGLVPLFKPTTQLWKNIFVFFIPANIIFILLGLFTLQTSGGLNIFNFLIVPILSFTIFGAFNLEKLKTSFFVPIFMLLVVLTLPRSTMQLHSYWQRYSSGKSDLLVTQAELELYTFIQNTLPPQAVVQAIPGNQSDRLAPYVSFFSNRSSYIAGVEMLKSHNQPTEPRVTALSAALSESDLAVRNATLRELGINYLLVPTDTLVSYNNAQQSIVFQNEVVAIIEVQ